MNKTDSFLKLWDIIEISENNCRQMLSKERLEFLLGCFPSKRIAVIGDFFLDKYLDVEPELKSRVSRPEKQRTRLSESVTAPALPEQSSKTCRLSE